MVQNIFVGFMVLIAIGAVVFGWWLENREDDENNQEQTTDKLIDVDFDSTDSNRLNNCSNGNKCS